jgi:hypothetical protein
MCTNVGVAAREDERQGDQAAGTAGLAGGNERATKKEAQMGLSDRLSELAKRAKEAEDRSRAAAGEATEQLRSDVERASAEARKQADELAQRKATAQTQASDRWQQVRNDWAKHVASVRANVKSMEAQDNAGMAKFDAEVAMTDANDAIDFALNTVEEAEYEVLNAILAQEDAEVAAAKAAAMRA